GGLHVGEPVVNDALLAALFEGLLALASAFFFLWCGALRCRCFALCHKSFEVRLKPDTTSTPSSSSRSRPCADPSAYARWCAPAAREPAARGDDAFRDSSRSPSAA